MASISNYITTQNVGIACGLGFLAYCVYFDHKRRNAPDYREKVLAKRESDRLKKESEDVIELPPLNDKAAVETFFAKEIELGEELMQAGEIDRAVKHLSYAIVLCPTPQQLLTYMREILPTNAYSKLVENVAIAQKVVSEAYRRSGLKEDDVE